MDEPATELGFNRFTQIFLLFYPCKSATSQLRCGFIHVLFFTRLFLPKSKERIITKATQSRQ